MSTTALFTQPTSVDELIGDMADFGTRLATLDCSLASNDDLDRLTAAFGSLESRIAVARSSVLSEIDSRGGDSVSSQKKHSKSSHSQAKRRKKTANALNKLPTVRKRMAAGKGMTSTKTDLLGDAAEKTSAADVDGDETLLARIEKQDDDQAKKTIAQWVRERQSNADRKTQRQKNIDARSFTMFQQAGMIHSHGQLPATAENLRVFRRWETEKSRLWRLDGGRKSAHKSIRSDEQRGADAYANVIDGIDGTVDGLRDRADWCADVEGQPPMPGAKRPQAASDNDTDGIAAGGDAEPSAPTPASAPRPAPPPPPRAQVVIVVQNETLDTSDPDVMADIVGGGPLLRSELDRHLCNADVFGQLFDPTTKNPLWEGRRVRTCTDPQWRALLVRDGACVLTGADAAHCEAHHIGPFEAPIKGESNIDNLVMVSTAVHHWLHDNELTIYRALDGSWHTRPATPEEIAPRGRRSDE